jgi:hypothetical protein
VIFAQVGESEDRIKQWATALGLSVETPRGDAALRLARLLVEAGHDPAQPYGTMRGYMPCMMYRSLGEAAGLTVRERDNGKDIPRFRKFTPYPGRDE